MFPLCLQLLTPVKRSISHLFNSLRVPFFFSFSLKYPGCSFPNHPNFYPFSQQHFSHKTNSKSSPRISRYIRYRQNFEHILDYLVSNPLFPNILFNKTWNPTTGGNSQNIHLPRQTQKMICLLVALPQWWDHSRQFRWPDQKKSEAFIRAPVCIQY